MKRSLSRRVLLGLLAAIVSLPKRIRPASARQQSERRAGSDATRVDRWHQTHDRVWLGESFWANPMEDWRIVNGAAETRTDAGDRSVHLITHRLSATGSFEMSVHCRRVKTGSQDGGAGFKIGIRHSINDYRSDCFERDVGVTAGLIEGSLTLATATRMIADPFDDGVVLTLTGEAGQNDTTQLTLTAQNAGGTQLGTVTHTLAAAEVAGNVAIVSNFDKGIPEGQGARYRFSEWKASGDAFEVNEDRRFGPILWSMYSMDDTRGAEGFVVKLTALLPPLGDRDERRVELLTQRNGSWRSFGIVEFDPEAYTATFRLPNWDQTTATPFRVVYRERHTDDCETIHEWLGEIRANPSGRAVRLAALGCQRSYAFPYVPLVKEVEAKDPDLLFFSGDQLYELNGGYDVIRTPASLAILSYLCKYYMFGWAFREVMRNRPTLCTPDDHDVFQGNLWGESGRAMDGGSVGSSGGYVQPVRMVNVVHRTHTSHHPDPYDSRPVQRGISVYYGDMIYGNVGFAIIGDRQFKSGPERVDTGYGRRDHVVDPALDTATLDAAGLDLLGQRQEDFLTAWSTDWDGHAMKVLLSQTLFAGAATHHGTRSRFVRAVLDNSSWPQTPRNRLVRILRTAKCLHVCGDQHLPSLIQYGADAQRDSCWAFCAPAISVGYTRWWVADSHASWFPVANRPSHGRSHTGEYQDGFGNYMYVYAVANPRHDLEVADLYVRARNRTSGFGLVTIDTTAKTYKIAAFRFPASEGVASTQFTGWPVTVKQDENGGDNELETESGE